MNVKLILGRIKAVAESVGYKVTTYANHLIIYNDEFKADVTVIDDEVIIIQSRGFPYDRINIMNVFELMKKTNEELLHVLGL